MLQACLSLVGLHSGNTEGLLSGFAPASTYFPSNPIHRFSEGQLGTRSCVRKS